MDIWEEGKLTLFIAFVIPGFISLKFYELINANSHKESSKLLIDAVAFSCVNYGILFWAIALVQRTKLSSHSEFLYYAFYLFVLFIAPVLWAFVWTKIRKSAFIQKYAPHPTLRPWDYVFSQRNPYWMIVTLNNGEKLAGRYSFKSFASSDPANEQLYLEEQWLLNNDGGFERAVNSTSGVLITAHEILYIELFLN